MTRRKPRPKAERGQPVAEFDPKDPVAKMMAAVHNLKNNVLEVEKTVSEAGRKDIAADFDCIRVDLMALRAKLLEEYVKARRHGDALAADVGYPKKKADTDGQ